MINYSTPLYSLCLFLQKKISQTTKSPGDAGPGLRLMLSDEGALCSGTSSDVRRNFFSSAERGSAGCCRWCRWKRVRPAAVRTHTKIWCKYIWWTKDVVFGPPCFLRWRGGEREGGAAVPRRKEQIKRSKLLADRDDDMWQDLWWESRHLMWGTTELRWSNYK